MAHLLALDRRRLLKAGGALVVGFAVDGASAPSASAAADAGPLPSPDQLDSFIAVRRDGSVVALFGKMDPGQGIDIAIAQIVAEELDVAFDRVQVVMGDTLTTVNQGGASASTGVAMGGVTLRYAAAEARRVLLARAAERLATPVETLDVADGVVRVSGNPSRSIGYGALVGGGHFETALKWNGKVGSDSVSQGLAKPKSPDAYKIVGRSIPRTDLRENVFGRQIYVTDIRVPGMLHARVLRPPTVGVSPTSVDSASLAAIPNCKLVQVQRPNGTVLAVAAEKEWDAIRGARALKVAWTEPAPAFPEMAALYDYIRQAPTTARDEMGDARSVDFAVSHAHRVVTAEYEWPFQSHASMGPACAVADVRNDGATVWSGTQKPHYAREGVAKLLGMAPERVRVIWTRGPGSYGRNDAGDAALDAAMLSRELARPVRLQYMRDQGTAWDPKGPASTHRCTAAFDADGRVVAFQFLTRGFSRQDVQSNESDPRDSLSGQLLGLEPNSVQRLAHPIEDYGFPAAHRAWETVPALVRRGSPLRTSHMRDPVGPQTNFASESFIDEMAHTSGMDPLAFRLAWIRPPRGVAVLKAAAEKFGWAERRVGEPAGRGDMLVGRGLAYAQRGETLVAAITEVEVDRTTGVVRPRRWVVAHDCGLIINPETLRRTIEGNIVQATSRALFEEVRFDRRRVTSVDWATYPILDMAQAPDSIEVVMIDRPDEPSGGAGEASTRPVPAAIANAIFDATGARLRRVPFTPERIKDALARTAAFRGAKPISCPPWP